MDSNERNEKIYNGVGALSAFYLSVSYIVGIIIFLIVLKYPEITNDLEKIELLLNYKNIIFFTNILMYILFGPIFVLFIISLKEKFKETKCILLTFSTVIGFIWAGSLVASGMIANAAIEPVLSMYKTDVVKASFFWQIIDTVSMGIGNGNGEILGGIFTLFLCISALMNNKLNKFINIVGIIVGIIGILSVIPMLNSLGGIFGITQIVWFICVGIMFLSKDKKRV